jgi:hypothetical protein
MGTRIDTCVKCGAEDVQIAARDLCYSCYRAEERARERPLPDRHNPALRREHKKLFKAFSQVMGGLTDLGAVQDDVLDVREILQPYLESIQEYLNAIPTEPKDTPPEPSEQKPEAGSLFTVDRPGEELKKPGKRKRRKFLTMPK